MRIAQRLSKLGPEGAFKVLAAAEELERQGKSIVHFEIGQPDFNTFSYIKEAGIDAINSGKTKYTPSLGTMTLRKELAKTVSEQRGVKLSYRNVAVTPGCKPAIFAALASVVDRGDEVIYPDPSFPAYKILIDFFGGEAVPIPLLEERKFSFDMQAFKKKVSNKTRAIIINSPGNPTGTIIPKEDLIEIADIAKKNDIWVITYEIYSGIIYSDKRYESIYSIPGMKGSTFIVDGFSKIYAMTGWRLGYLIMPESMETHIDYLLNNAVSCTASFTQEAGLVALKGSQRDVRSMVRELRRRRDFVVEKLNEIPGITCAAPSGAFYAFPNVKSFHKRSQEIADYLLRDFGVALLDGTAFGKSGEGYLRISYATNMENLEEGLKRMKIGLQTLSAKL
ncbi:MAG: aspartate aminotransferase [Candidatus Levybacteria bacterium RIFCSPLOWO2_12_FULL_37_14]|nr:MAG: aspartate aminotransferase [Candidatus Levybacteria bacterium RIFCSPLOWO2_12_FULL_37_14]